MSTLIPVDLQNFYDVIMTYHLHLLIYSVSCVMFDRPGRSGGRWKHKVAGRTPYQTFKV